MKRIWTGVMLLLALMICLAGAAGAEGEQVDFTLDERAVIAGMDKSWMQGYEPTGQGNTLNVCLPIVSDTVAGKITATLIMEDEASSPLKSRKLSADFWKNERLYSVRLQLNLIDGRVNGDYPARVRIEGQRRDGSQAAREFPLTIRVRDATAWEGVRPQIRLITRELTIGEEGAIRAEITNPGRCTVFSDMRVIITDGAGDILPLNSDTLEIGPLAPGETCEIEYPVSVRPKAEVAVHGVKARLSYSASGQAGEWEETFSLPVTQEIRLEQGGIQMASSVVRGDMASLTLPLMNMGRADVSNVTAALTLPGITQRQMVLVGVIAPGETKQAKISFTPGKDAPQEVEGEVEVACEDAWGNQETFTLPVAIRVEEPAIPASVGASSPSGEKEEEKPPYLLWGLAGGCALLLILLILQGALLRGKIRKLEEDRL